MIAQTTLTWYSPDEKLPEKFLLLLLQLHDVPYTVFTGYRVSEFNLYDLYSGTSTTVPHPVKAWTYLRNPGNSNLLRGYSYQEWQEEDRSFTGNLKKALEK